ncbi:hypothetical protein D910_07912 [Dendroctonus ponderosae]|uniref:Uncharacterized protein n=1 Tax=Dendroctonus ponderosae TaxID=77166 RepID=U4UKN8_DENPD|nr:hypothetical protein D910_07912 [Dendroctonus ponderosae]
MLMVYMLHDNECSLPRRLVCLVLKITTYIIHSTYYIYFEGFQGAASIENSFLAKDAWCNP